MITKEKEKWENEHNAKLKQLEEQNAKLREELKKGITDVDSIAKLTKQMNELKETKKQIPIHKIPNVEVRDVNEVNSESERPVTMDLIDNIMDYCHLFENKPAIIQYSNRDPNAFRFKLVANL